MYIFRDAVSDLALHFLAKMKIMVVKDIEREDIEFVCKVSIDFTAVMRAKKCFYSVGRNADVAFLVWMYACLRPICSTFCGSLIHTSTDVGWVLSTVPRFWWS